MDEKRQICRQPITIVQNCALGIVSLDQLAWSDHVVQFIDISNRGVGIESEEPIVTGFAWFHTRIDGYRGGIVVWSRPTGNRYREGIRFVSLSSEDERILQNWPPYSDHLRPCCRLEDILALYMKCAVR